MSDISNDLLSRLNTLGGFLRSKIVGQDEVLADIVNLLQRGFCGLRFPGRPVASMLFLGSPGVGKNTVAQLLTRHLFGSEEKLVSLYMADYITPDSIGILRSHLALYYHQSGGSGTILLDPIEAAHPLITEEISKILRAARFTLANGETLDLRNYVVVATSHIGSKILMESRPRHRETLVERGIQVAKQEMPGKTFDEFDLHCVFNNLNHETLNRIAGLLLQKCLDLVNSQGHAISLESGVLGHIQREGHSEEEKYSAWPMEHAVMRIVGGVVADEMLKNDGRSVRGVIGYDPQENKCFLKKP